MTLQTPGTVPPPGGRRPLGTSGWLALSGALLAGVVYTVGLAVVVALASGSVFGAIARASDGARDGTSDDPFDSDPWHDFGGSTDPLQDYPGITDGDSGYVLAQPSAAEVRSAAADAVAAAQAVATGPWSAAGDEFNELAENDYDGTSMLYDYTTGAESLDRTFAEGDKQALVDALTAALEPLGYDTVEVADDPDEWDSAGYEVDGHDDETGGESSPLWIVSAHSSTSFGPWVEFGIVENADDEIRDALDEWDIAAPDSGLYVQAYAWGLLEESDRADFIDALDDFGGVAPYDDGTASA
ncbi:hypothetical protein HQQ80_16070 [Microbacteriaceae bacterium VKM Ac-2855]|nr:hypothetical protein [Microbacteriaceae bacterium VKM Ac-2855]